ncbi:Cullin binding-domain-containing protein [Gongronella butleri]|nr:Cullin binding-domain-containing protein [Gongronella butleri]
MFNKLSSMNGSRDEKTRALMDVASLSQKDAQMLLKQVNWDVQQALNMYYEKPLPKGNVAKVTALFDKFQDPEQPDVITVDGTIELCQALGMDPTHLEFLLASYHLGSEQMGEFHRKPFVNGCLSMRCETIEQLKAALAQLHAKLMSDQAYFRKIYNYAFLFGRQNGQKNLALDAAIELWKLLLASRFSHLDQWTTFLEAKHKKAISKDTWTLFLDFALQPNFDVDTHDAEGAWPILIDEFVDYLKQGEDAMET